MSNINSTKRKYEGVPTQNEIIAQFNTLKFMVKDIKTIEQIKEFKKEHLDINIEVNYDTLDSYDEKVEIHVIRYEFKNILVYFNINDFGDAIVDNIITVYTDDGDQLGDEKYDDYEKEIERVAEMGLLTLIQN